MSLPQKSNIFARAAKKDRGGGGIPPPVFTRTNQLGIYMQGIQLVMAGQCVTSTTVIGSDSSIFPMTFDLSFYNDRWFICDAGASPPPLQPTFQLFETFPTELGIPIPVTWDFWNGIDCPGPVDSIMNEMRVFIRMNFLNPSFSELNVTFRGDGPLLSTNTFLFAALFEDRANIPLLNPGESGEIDNTVVLDYEFGNTHQIGGGRMLLTRSNP